MSDKRFRFTLHDFIQSIDVFTNTCKVSVKIRFVRGENEEGFDPFGFASKWSGVRCLLLAQRLQRTRIKLVWLTFLTSRSLFARYTKWPLSSSVMERKTKIPRTAWVKWFVPGLYRSLESAFCYCFHLSLYVWIYHRLDLEQSPFFLGELQNEGAKQRKVANLGLFREIKECREHLNIKWSQNLGRDRNIWIEPCYSKHIMQLLINET